jgi:hypothetical protein
VAKKTGKHSATKKAVSKPSKTTARPAAKAAKKPAPKPAVAPAPKLAAAPTPKLAAVPAAKPAAAPAAKSAAAPAAKRAGANAAHPGLPVDERARQLHADIARSKLTHPDPWRYAAKARGWGERAQVIVELITVRGETASALSSLEALVAELDKDRDFQEARRLF